MAFEAAVDPFPLELRKGRQAGGGTNRVAVHCAADKGEVAVTLAPWISAAHQLRRAADCGQRVAAADRLAVDDEICNNTVALLSATPGETKASDHLIEDQ